MRETTSKFDREYSLPYLVSAANNCIAEEKLVFTFIEFNSVVAVANAISSKESTPLLSVASC